jgi:hypothetical protein
MFFARTGVWVVRNLGCPEPVFSPFELTLPELPGFDSVDPFPSGTLHWHGRLITPNHFHPRTKLCGVYL